MRLFKDLIEILIKNYSSTVQIEVQVQFDFFVKPEERILEFQNIFKVF